MFFIKIIMKIEPEKNYAMLNNAKKNTPYFFSIEPVFKLRTTLLSGVSSR